MSAARIVVTGRIPGPGLKLLESNGEVWVWNQDHEIAVDELRRVVAGADAIVTLLTTKVDHALLDAAGAQLRVVANVAVGYNNIDVAACRAAGVVTTNTPGVLTEPTADIAMALILMTTRRLAEGERLIRSGEPWRWGMFMMLGTGIQGRRLGIVGMGAIGQAVARRARAFGMSIVYSNRHRADEAVETELHATYVGLDELLASSHVVSINCPYSSETHHLIDAAALSAMNSNAYLINTARGPIVHEGALADALASGRIAGAGLDVYEREPTVEPRLLVLDNVVLLPHLGSATIETRTAMAELAARNVLAVLAGDRPITPILPATFERGQDGRPPGA